jgi:hypothetical protein
VISAPVVPDLAAVTPLQAFERLFENEFITLERLAISRRAVPDIDYLDETVALPRLFQDDPGPDEAPGVIAPVDTAPGDPALHGLHAAIYRAWSDTTAVVTGNPLELRALLVEGLALPASTSMMIKRGVPDLAVHLVDDKALLGVGQDGVLQRARALADSAGMQHVLLVTGRGLVCVAGPTMHETMAHYSNVAFAARVECLRLEELLASR